MQYVRPLAVDGSAQCLNLTVWPGPLSSIVSIVWDTGNGFVSCAAGLELYASLLGKHCFVKALHTSATSPLVPPALRAEWVGNMDVKLWLSQKLVEGSDKVLLYCPMWKSQSGCKRAEGGKWFGTTDIWRAEVCEQHCFPLFPLPE